MPGKEDKEQTLLISQWEVSRIGEKRFFCRVNSHNLVLYGYIETGEWLGEGTLRIPLVSFPDTTPEDLSDKRRLFVLRTSNPLNGILGDLLITHNNAFLNGANAQENFKLMGLEFQQDYGEIHLDSSMVGKPPKCSECIFRMKEPAEQKRIRIKNGEEIQTTLSAISFIRVFERSLPEFKIKQIHPKEATYFRFR